MSVSKKIISGILNDIAPLSYACSWDNSGFNIDINDEIKGIYICLDVTEECIREAVQKGCNLIVSHHPLLFNPVKKITGGDSIGKVICMLIKNNISLYSCHTPMDSCKGGINDYVAQMLNLADTEFLEKSSFEKFSKVVVTVPVGHEEIVKKAMFESGAGCIGEYCDCAFSSGGIGQFTPGENTQPFIGIRNVAETVEETRIEVVCPANKASDVVKGIISAHPYEEPAIDVFDMTYPSKILAGLGMIGNLPREIKLRQLADKLKEIYDLDVLRIKGDLDKNVKRIALCGGSAGEFITLAKSMGADVYITGEVKHNQYVEAEDIAVIEGGHYDTEKCFVDIMYRHLQNAVNGLQYNLDIFKTEVERRPFVNY